MGMFAKFVDLSAKNYVIRSFAVALAGLVVWWWFVSGSDIAKFPKVFIIAVAAALIAVVLEQGVDIFWKLQRFHNLQWLEYDCFGYAIDTKFESDGVTVTYAKARKALGGINVAEIERRLRLDPNLLYPTGSTATVSYLGDTSLEISLTEYIDGIRDDAHRNTWTGKCVMESDEVGIMAWAYDYLRGNPEPWKSNGVKRLHVIDGRQGQIKLCLSSYNDSRFGRELLVTGERKAQSHTTGEWPASWRLNLALVLGCTATLIVLAVFLR